MTGNYSRFFAAYNRLAYRPAREYLILQYTEGRTGSLRELTREEYDGLCDKLTGMAIDERQLRHLRSSALHQMQLIGVDTADWVAVNEYTQQPRIAGKLFAALGIDELDALVRKLRAIRAKQLKKDKKQSKTT